MPTRDILSPLNTLLRWTELEKESQERENRLLGELDEAEDGASSGAGKGRRGNGNRVSGTRFNQRAGV